MEHPALTWNVVRSLFTKNFCYENRTRLTPAFPLSNIIFWGPLASGKKYAKTFLIASRFFLYMMNKKSVKIFLIKIGNLVGLHNVLYYIKLYYVTCIILYYIILYYILCYVYYIYYMYYIICINIMYYIILMYYIIIKCIWLFLVVRYDYSMDDSVVDYFYSKIAVQ